MAFLFRRFKIHSSKPFMDSDKAMMTPATAETLSMSGHGCLTVVELFQSQGCSSCPPTNDRVIELADDAELLILTYEVTYWDKLGWTDTFGDDRWNTRQRAYVRKLGLKSAYTPQVVVNGRADGVGSSQKSLQAILAKGTSNAESNLIIEVKNEQIVVTGDVGRNATVYAVYYDNPKSVRIASGENSGRTLPHRNVVRNIVVIGILDGDTSRFDLPKRVAALDFAVIVQDGEGGPILGALRP